LRALDALDLAVPDLSVLDVGCGYGYWLRYLIELGADPTRLCGLDLSAQRLAQARRMNPAVQWLTYDGGAFPVAPEVFDLVMQSVVFSSIPHAAVRMAMATAMLAACRPGGQILWVDLADTRSPELTTFQTEEVLTLFPGCSVLYVDRLHPSWFRRLYKHAGTLCHVLYALTRWRCESLLLVLRKPSVQ
jgi:SAM-dependent methyltransferase